MARREPDEPVTAPKGEALKSAEPKAEPRVVQDGTARGLVPSAAEPAARVAPQQRVATNPSRDVSGRAANVPRVADPPPVGDAQNVAECLNALNRITDAGSLAQIAAAATARSETAEADAKVKAAEKAEAERAAARAKKPA